MHRQQHAPGLVGRGSIRSPLSKTAAKAPRFNASGDGASRADVFGGERRCCAVLRGGSGRGPVVPMSRRAGRRGFDDCREVELRARCEELQRYWPLSTRSAKARLINFASPRRLGRQNACLETLDNKYIITLNMQPCSLAASFRSSYAPLPPLSDKSHSAYSTNVCTCCSPLTAFAAASLASLVVACPPASGGLASFACSSFTTPPSARLCHQTRQSILVQLVLGNYLSRQVRIHG